MPNAVRKHVVNPIGTLEEIEQLIGKESTAKLVSVYGGTRLYIPGRLGATHYLSGLLGGEQAQRLVEGLGGLTLEIPRGVLSEIERRNKQILADRTDGMSGRKLALKYRLTERTIRKIVNS